MIFLLEALVLVLIDYHIDRGIKVASAHFSERARRVIRICMWTISGLAILGLAWYHFFPIGIDLEGLRHIVMISIVIFYLSKLFTVLFLIVDDIRVGIIWLYRRVQKKERVDASGEKISRSQFLAKTAIAAGVLPFSSSVFGILSGAGDYRLRHQIITLKNLPRQFDGIKIGQISDIHCGTYYNMTEVKGGVDLLLAEKADVIFFTGDLVNTRTSEVNNSISIFNKIKAPLGVFSVTGNHDYGNYAIWDDDQSKKKNFEDMIQAHKVLGYDLLMNEHRVLKVDGEQLAILGVENWGLGPPLRFPQYGKLDLAYKGTEEIPVKLLLSHDPSHWDAQIRPMYPSIDVTFAGHTHGFQIGIETPGFRWSPAQYKFKQWAGLYQTGDQYIYVNRGFGCIGYPGRIGIHPELTIIELKRG